MKNTAIWLIPVLFFVSNFIFAQQSKDFKFFLESFEYENKKDSLLMLGNITPPKVFVCGNDAFDYISELDSFRGGKGKSIKKQKLLQEFSEKIENPIFWYYLYGSVFTRDKRKKETQIAFEDNNRHNFFMNITRLYLSFEKINSKNVIYYVTFGNFKNKQKTIKSYHLIKVKNKWKLDKITSEAIEPNFDGVYPNN